MSCQVLAIDADGYQSNRLHHSHMPWQETNCYVDVWIELIHALGFDVEPSLAFTLAVDFEQDQWTFFKPPLNDLNELYGIEVEELMFFRPTHDRKRGRFEPGAETHPSQALHLR